MNQNMMNEFMNFMRNPSSYIQRMGIPPQAGNSPQSIIQFLMDSGRLTQADYNRLQQQAQQMANNPMFAQFTKR